MIDSFRIADLHWGWADLVCSHGVCVSQALDVFAGCGGLCMAGSAAYKSHGSIEIETVAAVEIEVNPSSLFVLTDNVKPKKSPIPLWFAT